MKRIRDISRVSISRVSLALAGLALLAAGTAAAGAITPDADTILYLACDSASFGDNLATASGSLTLTEQHNAVLRDAPEELATLRDGMAGTDAANGGFVYGQANGARAAIASRWSGAAAYCAGDFTFECFIRLDADASLGNGGQYLIRHPGAWMIQVTGEGVPEWKNKSWGQRLVPSSIKDGAWHHLAVVADRTLGTVAYYLDYRIVDAAKYVVPAGSAEDALEVNCGYGLNNWSIAGMAFDEVRIVKRALAPSEFIMPPARAEAFLAAAAAQAKKRAAVVTDDTLVYAPCDEDVLTGGSEMNALASADGKPALTLKLDATDATRPASAAASALNPFHETSFMDAAALANASCLTLAGKGRMVMDDTSYLADDFTLEFFFKATADEASAWTGDNNNNYVYLVHQMGGFYFRIHKDGPGKVAWNAQGTEKTLNTSYADGEWHHYAVVYERASRSLRLYIDREKVGSKTLADDLANLVTADTPLYIGAGAWGNGTTYVVNSGSYDEIRLTRKALRAVELLSPTRAPVFPETRAWLNFDNGVQPKALVEGAAVTAKSNALTFETNAADVAAAAFRATARGTEAFANAAALHVALADANSHVGGGGGYVVADPDGDFSTGSWTAEMFFKAKGPSKYYSYIFNCPDAWSVQLTNGSGESLKLRGNVADAAGAWTSGAWSASVGDDAWHHLAVVGDADARTVSFYLDYALLTRFEDVADPLKAGAARPTEVYCLGQSTNQWGFTIGPTEGWYDEIRLTKRALAVTEFATRDGEGLDAAAMRLDARFEEGWASSAETGNYAATVSASDAGATTSVRGRVSREILDASGEPVRTSRCGAFLTGGTVAYAGQGLFDEAAATCELFVKRTAGGADDSVVAFAKGTDAAQAFWKLTADGTFAVAGQDAAFPTVTLGDGAWHHLAVAYETADDGGVSVSLYWDHAPVATRTAAAFGFGTGAGLVLGSSGFSGGIDEVRIFPRALTAEEHLYAAPPRASIFLIR